MKTFENYSSYSNELQEVETLDTLQLMEQTSTGLVSELEDIYETLDGDNHGLIISVFGSPARYEMLPLSDVDVLLMPENENRSDKTLSYAEKLIRNLPYDKVDIPKIDILGSNKLRSLANSNSPDGHITKSLLVCAPEASPFAQELLDSRAVLDDPELQLEGLIFDYHFLSYRAQQKSTEREANLKYSEGGTRDIIYLDWAADFLSGAQISKTSRELALPQIELSIPTVADFLENEAPISELPQAINVLNTIKHQALELGNEGIYFDGLMSEQTATFLMHYYSYGEIVDSPRKLINIHTMARKTLSDVKDALYQKFINDVNSKAETDESAKYLSLIDRVWSEDPTLDMHAAVSALLERSRWVDIATVMSRKNATSSHIDHITNLALETPAYSHALRIAIRHPNTSTETLYKLLDADSLATDDDIDKRYRSMLIQRLGSL